MWYPVDEVLARGLGIHDNSLIIIIIIISLFTQSSHFLAYGGNSR
jgi:hypothetical protein